MPGRPAQDKDTYKTAANAWALKHGLKAGTVKSKFREASDVHHTHLGFETEARTIAGKRGAWEYRLVVRKPEQGSLFEFLEAI